MADTGKQSPLGVNVLGSLLRGHDITAPDNNIFFINSVAEGYFGKSKNNSQYDPGSIVNDTCLKWLTYALSDAWDRGQPNGGSRVNNATYDNILNIGQSRIAALGNSKPPTYQVDDPSGFWTKGPNPGPANTGLAIDDVSDHGQKASWDPWDSGNTDNSEVTKWGWVRAMALQAYNEFYFNAEVEYTLPDDYSNDSAIINDNPSYKDFTASFLTADGFIKYSNEAIFAVQNSQTFLQGTFSNQNDLISADVSGVSLSARAFGQDLINLGKVIDLSLISIFGLPSALLRVLQNNNALTQSVVLALLSSGLNQNEIQEISSGNVTPTKEQEQKMYGAFLVIVGVDLRDVLLILNCKTKKLESLADLLSIKKLFPTSYRTLTVPIYNTAPGPTNSKTYYLLFINDELNPQLISPKIKEIVGTIVPPRPPPIIVDPPSPPPPPPPREPEPTVIVVPQPPEIPAPDPPAPAVITPPPKPTEYPLIAIPLRDANRGIVPLTGAGGCPAPWMRILLSDGTYIPAGQLQKGMYVKTKHEHTLEEGSYRISSVTIELQPRVEITFDHITFICSTTHKFYHNNNWLEAQDVKYGDIISGKQVQQVKALPVDEVVRITVEEAHTYICEELLSHNKYATGGGGCVALESFVPLVETEQKHNGREITKAWMLESGMKISLGTDSLEIVDGNVVKTLNDYQPCVRISTADGIALVCSTTAPILTKDKGFIPATEVYGKRVAVMRNGRTWYDEVVGLEDVGMKFVRVIDAGNNSFWAGERPGAFILHHNVPINDNLNYDKK
jgi:hypothetical protein